MSGFSFIQITDHHLAETETGLVRGFSPAYALRAVLRHMAANAAAHADFILSTGDLVDSLTPSAYENFCKMMQLNPAASPPGPGQITIEGLRNFPIYIMPGNHDDRALFLSHLFPQAPQTTLVNTTFQHKGVQFISLDMGANAKAVLRRETLDFLSQALKTSLPTVVLTHHHVTPIGSRWLDEFIADDVQQFWDVLTDPGVKADILGVISGHTHMTYEVIVKGIPVFGLRSTSFPFANLDEPVYTLQPPHYRLVTIQDGLLTTRVFEVQL